MTMSGNHLVFHRCFGDGMVFQRSRPVRVAGRSAPGASISGSFRGASARASADASGEWELVFPAGAEGGPFELGVSDGRGGAAVLRDIMVGEVWLCSGQSNMEYPVGTAGPFWGLPDGAAVAAAGDAGIRLFHVPRVVSPEKPLAEPPVGSKWKSGADPSAVSEFSAVAWFFGLALRRELGPGVPVGLVHSSWGGTRIEPWISRSSYEKAGFSTELGQIDDAIAEKNSNDKPTPSQSYLAEIDKVREWLRDSFFATDPQTTAEALRHWAAPTLPPGEESKWLRGSRGSHGLLSVPGVAWFRRKFTLPKSWTGRKAILTAVTVNDCDETFIDGGKIGETGLDTPGWWAVSRHYAFTVPETADGCHVLAVRVQNHYASGSFAGPLTISLVVDEGSDGAVADDGDEVAIDGGEWLERLEFTVDPAKAGIRPPVSSEVLMTYDSQQLPATLFNSMIAPFRPLVMRGAIWYQGCSNAADPDHYAELQKLLVQSWRDEFREPDFAFIATQLAAYQEHHPQTRLPDDWWKALTPKQACFVPSFVPLRAVQERMLDMRGCGLACTIDVGDHSDIHPSRKRPVGERLAHEALRLCYGRADALPGPRAISAAREGAAVRVALSDCPGGVEMRAESASSPRSPRVAAAGHLFALRDAATGEFEWADAEIRDDGSIIVSAPGVKEPDAVQYAWSSFPPDADLRRRADGVPVFPFSISVSSK